MEDLVLARSVSPYSEWDIGFTEIMAWPCSSTPDPCGVIPVCAQLSGMQPALGQFALSGCAAFPQVWGFFLALSAVSNFSGFSIIPPWAVG